MHISELEQSYDSHTTRKYIIFTLASTSRVTYSSTAYVMFILDIAYIIINYEYNIIK